MELLWGCLLALSSLAPKSRLLAGLLAAKWAASYFAASAGWWREVAAIDIAFGGLFVLVNAYQRDAVSRWVASIQTVVLLAHGWHWLLWDAGAYVGVTYFHVMLWLFTAQVFALLFNLRGVADCVDVVAVAWGRLLHRLVPAPYQRVGRRARTR